MAKLHLSSRAQLVRLVLGHGWEDDRLRQHFCTRCPGCGMRWAMHEQLLSDREVKFLDYRAASIPNVPGLVVFSHERCGAILAVAHEEFKDLVTEPMYAPSCAATGKDENFCLGQPERQSCPLMCVCAAAHRISRIIQDWPKRKAVLT